MAPRITPTNSPPATPTLSSSGSCAVASPHYINFVSTDPDGDNLRYGVDWDADGSIDQWVPPSGYVATGSTQSASRTYSMAGEKTVQVLAQGEGGLSSDWASTTFSCTETPPPAAQWSDEGDNDGDGLLDSLDPDCTATNGFSEFPPAPNPTTPPAGPAAAVLDLRVIPSLVRRGSTTKVNWSAQNVESCTVTGTNGDTCDGRQSPIGGETSTPITGETRYTLSCIDEEGAIQTKQATVRIIPTFQEL